MKKLAFTMSEALIVLGIIAVLATLSIIGINSAKPDENIVMYRKAYGTTLKVIKNLMSDRTLYPNALVVAKNSLPPVLEPKFNLLIAGGSSEFTIGGGSGSCAPQVYVGAGNSCPPGYSSSGALGMCNIITPCPPATGGGSSGYSSGIIPGKDLDTGTTLTGSGLGSSTSTSTSTSTSSSSSGGIEYGTPIEYGGGGEYGGSGSGSGGGEYGGGGSPVTPIASSSGIGSGDILPSNFENLLTLVYGKGFSDSDVSEKMVQKYPFLTAGTPIKFGLSFMYRLNRISSNADPDNRKVNFTTADGFYWEIQDHFADASNPYAAITVYIDGENHKNSSCYYSDSCKIPNKFTFIVETSGKVLNRLGETPSSSNDPIACSYGRYSSVTKNSKIPTDSAVNTCFQ